MLNQATIKALQDQFNSERQNSAVYSAIAATFDNMSYEGFAKFFFKHAIEEDGHAHRLADFLVSKNIQPEYRMLDAVILPAMSPLSLAQVAYTLELRTTDNLEGLYDVADGNGDHQVCAYLVWFLNEQVEEEKWSFDLQYLLGRTDETGWLLLDQQYSNK